MLLYMTLVHFDQLFRVCIVFPSISLSPAVSDIWRFGLKEKREIDVFLQFILRHSPCGRVHMEGIDRVGDDEDLCGNISGKAGGRISEGVECPLCVIGRKDAMCMIW